MDQQFSLSWNNFHGNLSKGFAGLLGNREFVDVTIAVDGHLLQAHKVILSICSPYFKKMFQLNPCQHPIVVLRDVSHKAMTDLLQFMYHGEVSVKREDLTSFIGTAEVLQIKGLTNKETEDNDIDSEPELPKRNVRSQYNVNNETESCVSEPTESNCTEEHTQNNETELYKHKQFIEKLHRLSNLKRKSEEYVQNNFYSTDVSSSSEKRPKFKEKTTLNVQNVNNFIQGNNYEHIRNMFEESTADISTAYTRPVLQKASTNKEHDKCNINQTLNTSNDNTLELKTECEDSDTIIVTDPALSNSPNSYDGSKDGQKGTLDYPTVQDNCSSLTSLFTDLKKLVNGKSLNLSQVNCQDDFTRGFMNHRLITIPQKEDGKKKYPQRSCRLCWKLGKRRDTRFMCNACELPFCKNPCFEVHYNEIIKATHIHTDYFAT